MPADRVQALRRAFDATMKDKDLLADAEKQGLEVNPATGEEMQEMLKKVYATPKDVINRLAEATKDTARPEGAEPGKEVTRSRRIQRKENGPLRRAIFLSVL